MSNVLLLHSSFREINFRVECGTVLSALKSEECQKLVNSSLFKTVE
jgi:hypothetical protein